MSGLVQVDEVRALTDISSIDSLALKTYEMIIKGISLQDGRKKDQRGRNLARALISQRHSVELQCHSSQYFE